MKVPYDVWERMCAAEAEVLTLCAEVDRLRDTVQDYKDDIRKTLDDRGADDEVHCFCVPALCGEIARLRAQLDGVIEAVDAGRHPALRR